MNYYQHHIGDYRRDTAHLTLLEHGVYRQLLDMYYLSESHIPEETESVYRRLCARTEEEKKAVDTVLGEFFRCDNGWSHTRCDKVIADYKAKADRARDNGKLGGRPPKTKGVISGNPEETEEKANHKPLTINHKPLTNKRGGAFLPPSVADVADYCVERKNQISPQGFVDFYASKNWMIGKNKMKDWRACVRTWEQRDGEQKPPQHQTQYRDLN